MSLLQDRPEIQETVSVGNVIWAMAEVQSFDLTVEEHIALCGLVNQTRPQADEEWHLRFNIIEAKNRQVSERFIALNSLYHCAEYLRRLLNPDTDPITAEA